MFAALLLHFLLLFEPPPSMMDGPGKKPSAPTKDDPSVRVEEYREKLLALLEKDQQVRLEAEAYFRNVKPGSLLSPADKLMLEKQARASRENIAELKKLMAKWGFPGYRKVGADATAAAINLVQHADKDVAFMKQFLAGLKKAEETRDARKSDVAELTDRVLMAEGKKQLYGTMISVKGSKIAPVAVEDPKNLDKRRAQMGLPPMEEYLERIKARYGPGDKGGG